MNQFKLVFRNIRKKQILTVLRMISIIIGVGVALYIFELNSYENSYDTFWEDADNIYRVALIHEENGEVITHSARNFLGTPELLKAEIPGVEAACGFGRDVINIFCNEQQFNEVNWLWADTSIFSVLNRNMVFAENNDYWNDIHAAVISESFAKKMYGDKNPINQEFTLNEGWEFYVKAVFEDVPANSHLDIDVVASRASLMYYMRNFNNATRELVDNSEFRYGGINPYNQGSWGTPFTFRRLSYIKLAKGMDIQQVKNNLPAAFEKIKLPGRYADSNLKFDFQPLKSIHLKSNLEQEYKSNGSETRVKFLNLIAFVVLLVSIINFLNLTNIQTIENGKQYAIHILNGAKVSSILRLIFLENILVVLVSGVLGVGILASAMHLLLPVSTLSVGNLLFILAVLVGTAFISVVIPYFSSLRGRFQAYIKSQNGSLPGTWRGRKTMVIVQFTIAILLICGTILIRKQMEYMSSYRLGFEPQQTMFSFSPMSMNHHPELTQRLASFKNEVMKVPGVEAFAVSSSVPGRDVKRESDNVRIGQSAEPLSTSFTQISTTEDYIKLFDIELLDGRNFIPQAEWHSDEVLVNRTALSAMNFANASDAIGEIISIGNNKRQIVGVINDYHHMSLKNKVSPTIIEQNLNWEFAVGFYSIRFNANRTKEVHSSVSEIWERIYPLEVASFNFTDEVFNAQYKAEQKFQKITTYGSLLALFISCIGLFAIAAFDTQKRIKEIGVRKVNGAKISEILTMLNKNLIKWVLLAFVIACPIAWYAMNLWLENFAYKTTLSWWIFALAGILALGIALLTVSWQSWRAATRNPVEALRYE